MNALNSRLLVVLVLFICSQSGISQTALTAISGTYVDANNAANDYTATSPSNATGDVVINTSYGIFFARNTTTNNNLEVNSYSIGATTYSFLLDPDTLAIRRRGSATRLSLWIEADGSVNNTSDEIYLRPERQVPERSLYRANLLNIGYDNVLINTGANSSNIERIDVIYRTGMLTSTPANAIIPVMDRGGNGVFDIAAILSLDASGNPASYGSLVAVEASDFGENLINFSNSILFLQQALGEAPIPTGSSNQNLGGVGISFSELGIAANQILYGYSLFSEDVDETIHTLTDISTFPADSDNSGLDMAAGAVSAVSSDGSLVKANGPGGYKAALNTWLKANTGVTTATDNSTVTLWDDQSLGNHNATTLSTAPTFRDGSASGLQDINFNPTVDFIAATDRGLGIQNNSDYNSGGEPYTRKAFNIAFRTDNVTVKQQLYEQGGTTRGINIYIEGGQLYATAWNQNNDDGGGNASPWNTGSTIAVVNTTVNTNSEYIVTMEFNGSSAGTGTITGYLNGRSFGTISNVGQLFDHGDAIGLGRVNGGSRYRDNTSAATSFYGSIPEFIYCTEPASFPLSQRRKIESYLALKFGITLDQSTAINYLNSKGQTIFNTSIAASIGGYLEYNKDIAGIGRDDASVFEQKTSQSENTGSLVRIKRNGSIGADNNWMIWGNDAGVLTETTLNTPDTVLNRLTRVWRASEVGEIGVTDVSFDITDLGFGTSPKDFALLVAEGGTAGNFSAAEVITGGTTSTIDSRTFITFSGVDIDNQEYFTLATELFECAPGGVLNANLQLWLRADKGTNTIVNGADVTSWVDQTRNDNDASASNAPVYNANNHNYNPAIDFTAANSDNMIIVDGTNDSPDQQAVFLVGTMSASSSAWAPFLMKTASYSWPNGWGLARNSSSAEVFFHKDGYAANNNGADYASRTITYDEPTIHVAFKDATNYNYNLNLGTVDTDLPVSGYLPSNNITFLGATPNGTGTTNNTTPTSFLDGSISEVIMYDDDLNPTERQRIASYLAIKYGLTIDQGTATNYLAADGGIVWNATDNSTYNNDIAGIGRDDNSCLVQLQSKSQNANSIVTMGLGLIAASNATNANTFANNDAFLVWGNNGASANEANTIAYTEGAITERMLRIWRADENAGAVGATSISFNLASLGYTGSLSDYQLIISNASTLTTPTIVPATTFSGDVVTFNDVNLTDGQYFTLGTARTACGPGGVTANLYVWLRADAGTSTTNNNTTLATWSDQSATSTNATQDGNPPLFKNNTTDNINFNPTIDFDGTNDRLSLGNLANIKSGAPNSGDYTLIGIGIRQSSGNTQYVLGSEGGTGNQDLHFGYRNNTAVTIAHWGNDMDVAVNAFNSPQAPFLLFAEYDGTTRIVEETRGGNFARNTEAESTDMSGTKTNYVGDVNSLANYNGLISETIIFENDITDLQKQQVYSYLGLKYGITLSNNNDGDGNLGETISGSVTEGDYVSSNGSTIVWDYSANTTYHNDIAGIGRDDASCWLQKQSRSEDTDDVLTIGLGSIADTNGENVNIFNDDRDYLVWGNNNGSTTDANVNTVDVPVTIAERMTRIWKAQDTGTVGETEIQFNLTGLGYTVTNATDFSLLIGNTATMADAVITKGATLNGNVISFTGINLTNGQFFTLATQNTPCGPGGVNTSIALWLRADIEVFSDAGTTPAVNGANVLQWNDQSSSSNNTSENNAGGGSPVEPTLRTNDINFNPVIRFADAQSTNNSWLETATNGTSANFSLISVFKTAQSVGSTNDFTDSPALISAEAGGTNDYALGLGQGRVYINAANNNDYSIRPATVYADDLPRMVTGTRTQATSGTGINLFVNSQNVGSAASGTTNLNSASTFAIGNHSDYDADGQFEGDIGEVIVFNKVLTDVERARVDSYLAIKYGLTRNVTGLSEAAEDYLAADGGIIWNIDDQGVTYHNGIFGIGRDDLSCFEQTKSKSENSDALVTFDLGGSFSTNDSFILSGHDNALIEQIRNQERPLDIKSRLYREWKVQETGTVGAIKLTYDLSTITGPLGVGTNDLNQLRLMVNNTSDFRTGTTLIEPTSINAVDNNITFTVDFTSGQYYTLGSIEEDALPIILLSFEASNVNDKKVELDWSTASETNNAFFSIEKSTDGINFEKIGQLQGANTSESIINYKFVDNDPSIGNNFYRLKQTDFSGEFTYSEIQRVHISLKARTGRLRVFPNPVEAGQDLNLQYELGRIKPTRIRLLTMTGAVIYDEILDASAQNSSTYIIPTSSLKAGLYILKVYQVQNQISNHKVLIR